MLRTACYRLIIAFALFAFAPLTSFAQTSPFNLPAQPLAESLKAVGAQTGLNIMVSPPLVDGKQAPALKANLSAKDALARLLTGTKLEYYFVNDQTVVVREKVQAVAVSDPPATQPTNPPAKDTKEAGKNSSQDFRVAQVDQASAGPQAVEEKKEQKRAELQEVVVTGSRIPVPAKEVPQEVQIYTRDQILESGQTTVTDFLNTLPIVSTALTENSFQSNGGTTTVQLHGLPQGTTLVLLNGRQVETSGVAGQSGLVFFDLNTIPAAAIERIEVIPTGSSAIYGADAIAGVVNIILRRNLTGLQLDAKFGGATGEHEDSASFAAGHQWDRASVSIVGSYQYRSELSGAAHDLTADNNYARFGGIDARSNTCPLANVFSLTGTNLPGITAPYAAVPKGYTGTPTQAEFASTAGTLNSCSYGPYYSMIPESHRYGLLMEGHFEVSKALDFFTESLFSRVEEQQSYPPPALFGIPAFQSYTVGASNPFNPFGQAVGVSQLWSTLGPSLAPVSTTFLRPLVGIRGDPTSDWHYELAGWISEDQTHFNGDLFPNATAIQDALNATTVQAALNPFIDGPAGSPALLNSTVYTLQEKFFSRLSEVSGFVRGSLLQLPAGPLGVVLGGEYSQSKFYSDQINFPGLSPYTRAAYSRHTTAAFTEIRAPLFSEQMGIAGLRSLVATAAARNDRYSDFGQKTTPQFGLEWSPIKSILVRGSYSESFKAPALLEINAPTQSFPGSQVTDPQHGNQLVSVTQVLGGNPNLEPETGRSRSLGIVYSAGQEPSSLVLSADYFNIDLANSIQQLDPQTVVDNPSLFSQYLVRDPTTGTLLEVKTPYINFGHTRVEGFDYSAKYRKETVWGEWSPSLAITDTFLYETALTPGAPSLDRVSVAQNDGNWAPRWKATAAVSWSKGPFSSWVDGRFVGRYQDYAPLANGDTRYLGRFWYFDINGRCDLSKLSTAHSWFGSGAYISVGAVNVLNRLPQYSAAAGGVLGFDPTQGDIRGRFVYVQLGDKW